MTRTEAQWREEKMKEYWPNGEPATRKTVEKLCAVLPERFHERAWARWDEGRGGWLKADVLKLIEDVKAAKAQEVAIQTNRQSNERLRAMEIEKERGQYMIQVAHNHAIEEKYAWEQYAAQIERDRYDPCGLWGEPTLASKFDR